MSWRESAACIGQTPSFFDTDYSRALAVCRTCPVKAPCLRFAIKVNETHGVWGGATPAERERLAKVIYRRTA